MATQSTPNQPIEKNKQGKKNDERQFNQNDGSRPKTDVSERDLKRNGDKSSDKDSNSRDGRSEKH